MISMTRCILLNFHQLAEDSTYEDLKKSSNLGPKEPGPVPPRKPGPPAGTKPPQLGPPDLCRSISPPEAAAECKPQLHKNSTATQTKAWCSNLWGGEFINAQWELVAAHAFNCHSTDHLLLSHHWSMVKLLVWILRLLLPHIRSLTRVNQSGGWSYFYNFHILKQITRVNLSYLLSHNRTGDVLFETWTQRGTWARPSQAFLVLIGFLCTTSHSCACVAKPPTKIKSEPLD